MKKLFHIIGVLIIIFILIFILFLNVDKQEDVIKIGLIYPLTGPLSDLGIQHLEGVIFAVDKINESGGINGKIIKLYVEDSEGQPSKGVDAYNKLTKINNVKIIFGTLSNIMLSIAPLAEEDKIILFADASHPLITKDKKYVFRHAATSIPISKEIVNFSKEDINSATIIYPNTDYGIEFNNEIILNLNNKYSNINIHSEMYESSHVDFKTQVSKILDFNPDIIYLIGMGNSYGIWIKQLRELGYNNEIFSDFAPVITPSSLEIPGNLSKGLNYTNYSLELLNNYNNKYFEKYNQKSSGSFSFITYGNVELIYNAILDTDYDTESISLYIRNLNSFNGEFEVMVLDGQDIYPPIEINVIN